MGPKPHVLGGSNNLRSERERREKAETKLQSTRQSLRLTTQEITPQLQQLTQAVKTLQIERRHQLQLDEASQEVLETLQQQINDVERRQQQCVAVDCRIENFAREADEQAVAERFELRTLVSRLQEVQDEHATEVRLLHQEIRASKEFMIQRVNAVEDAVESVRAEVARTSEQQLVTTQSHVSKIDDLDEKLFAIDKELLKLKLALPATVKAQMPVFGDLQGTTRIETQQDGGLSVNLKVQEVATDLEALKADAIAYRSADRRQFDALTNRLREAAKSHHALKKEVECRLDDMRASCDQMMVRVPSELSRRLQNAQSAFSDEIEALKSSVLKLEAFYNVQKRRQTSNQDFIPTIDSQTMQEQNKLSDEVRDLQKEVFDLREDHGARLARIDGDLLGLYDWTREKVASIRQGEGAAI